MNKIVQSPLRILLFVAIITTFVDGLSTKVKKASPIKKVAIIGSGISGLSLAHALENSKTCAKPYLERVGLLEGDEEAGDSLFGIETHVFDSRPSLNFQAGAGVQLNGGK